MLRAGRYPTRPCAHRPRPTRFRGAVAALRSPDRVAAAAHTEDSSPATRRRPSRGAVAMSAHRRRSPARRVRREPARPRLGRRSRAAARANTPERIRQPASRPADGSRQLGTSGHAIQFRLILFRDVAVRSGTAVPAHDDRPEFLAVDVHLGSGGTSDEPPDDAADEQKTADGRDSGRIASESRDRGISRSFGRRTERAHFERAMRAGSKKPYAPGKWQAAQ